MSNAYICGPLVPVVLLGLCLREAPVHQCSSYILQHTVHHVISFPLLQRSDIVFFAEWKGYNVASLICQGLVCLSYMRSKPLREAITMFGSGVRAPDSGVT
ncbi:hypothetical protein GE09DRAFT_1150500 [Coniochaeta sp. 2T2.1]|nr:hypothetical protein GE09DRAFT_1150500 [Coniochaeta sp. 2T2.1]